MNPNASELRNRRLRCDGVILSWAAMLSRGKRMPTVIPVKFPVQIIYDPDAMFHEYNRNRLEVLSILPQDAALRQAAKEFPVCQGIVHILPFSTAFTRYCTCGPAKIKRG